MTCLVVSAWMAMMPRTSRDVTISSTVCVSLAATAVLRRHYGLSIDVCPLNWFAKLLSVAPESVILQLLCLWITLHALEAALPLK